MMIRVLEAVLPCRSLTAPGRTRVRAFSSFLQLPEEQLQHHHDEKEGAKQPEQRERLSGTSQYGPSTMRPSFLKNKKQSTGRRRVKLSAVEINRAVTEQKNQVRIQRESDLSAKELLDFRYQLLAGNLDLIKDYESYIGKLPLEPGDTELLLRRMLHGISNRHSLLSNSNPRSQIVAQTLVAHYKSGRLPHDPAATAHLIKICAKVLNVNEAIGVFNWAESRGHTAIDLLVYGAMIHVLVPSRGSLESCESLYERGLEHLAHPYVQYLMSPNSVLPDPTMPLSVKGLSTLLLGAVSAARISNGNWRDGYLAIDTSLRLYPHAAAHLPFNELLQNLPLEMSMRLFGIVSLAGAKVNGPILDKIFTKLRKAQAIELLSRTDRSEAVFRLALAQVDLLHAVIATGQTFPSELARSFLLGMLAILPKRHQDLACQDREDFESLAISMRDTVHGLFASFGSGLDSWGSTFMKAASIMGNERLFRTGLQALIGTKPSLRRVEMRDMLVMATKFQGVDALCCVLDALQGLSGAEILVMDVKRLMEAVEPGSGAEIRVLAQIVSTTLGEAPDQAKRTQREIYRALKKDHASQERSKNGSASQDEEHNMLALQKERTSVLVKKLQDLSSLISKSLVRDIQSHPPNVPTLNARLCHYPEEWHRRLYEEIHIVPISSTSTGNGTASLAPSGTRSETKKTIPDSDGSTLVPTGLTYSDVRFRNFCGLNDLLLLGQLWDQHMQQKQRKSMTQSLDSIASTAEVSLTEEQWRDQVLHLRGLVRASQPTAEAASPSSTMQQRPLNLATH